MILYIRAGDGRAVPKEEACIGSMVKPGYSVRSTVLRDGERATFTTTFTDTAGPRLSLRDAAGLPVTLIDAQTGGRMKLTNDHIAAIEAEAAKAGMGVATYVADVLRYTVAA